MKVKVVALSVILLAATAALAQDTKYPKAKVSFDDFKGCIASPEVK